MNRLLHHEIVTFIGTANVCKSRGECFEFVALAAHRAVARVAKPSAEFVADVVMVKHQAVAVVALFVANRANIMFAGCCSDAHLFCGTFCISETLSGRFRAISAFRAFQAIPLFVKWLTAGGVVAEFVEGFFSVAFGACAGVGSRVFIFFFFVFEFWNGVRGGIGGGGGGGGGGGDGDCRNSSHVNDAIV